MKRLNNIVKRAKDYYFYDNKGNIYSAPKGKIQLLKGDKHNRYNVMSYEGKTIGFSESTFKRFIKNEWNEKEVWHNIEGYPDYMISNIGRVKSNKFAMPKLLKLHIDRYGYASVCLYKDNIQTRIFVHKLVAEAFIPNPNNLETINHIDHNKLNNTVENLEWLSRESNSLDGIMFRDKIGIYA